MAAQAELAGRIGALLTGRAELREVKMFGTLAFMVNEKLLVCSQKSGDLLVRVATERHDECVALPGAAQAEMGTGRSMGEGWITVASTAIATDEQLLSWLEIALEYNRQIGGSAA